MNTPESLARGDPNAPDLKIPLDVRLPVLPQRVNLAQHTWARRLIFNRWPLFLARTITLAGFVFTMAAGLFGSPVGSHNFAIIFVWIAWWTALKLVFIPFGGRSWCSVCPIPLPGEWMQQGGMLRAGKPRFGLNRRWPKALKGVWMQAGAFLLIGMFSAWTLTDGRLTTWVLLGLFLLAAALSLVFERRAFCSYLCPIGGFTGIYARTAPLEVRAVDLSVCAKHGDKTCYTVCPWGIYPVAQRDSSACGLCMECLRACPQDNLALNLRPFGTDLGQPRPSSRLDEAFLALVMLGSALVFAAVFTGPWGELKNAAYAIGTLPWLWYVSAFLALNLLLLPGLFVLAVWVGEHWSGVGSSQQGREALKRSLAAWGQVLLPLGLAAWVAFTVSFAFPKFHYVVAVLSDPLGWGWNLLGLAGPWSAPDVSWFSPLLQAAILLGGLFWAGRVARRLPGGQRLPRILPLMAFCLAYILAMLWLLVG